MVGADRHARTGFLGRCSPCPARPATSARCASARRAVLDELGIADVRRPLPGSLPYAVRKRVALARALVAEPDAAAARRAGQRAVDDEMDELGELIRSLTERMSVMLVEHHMDLVMKVCDEIIVLDFGRVIAAGTPGRGPRRPGRARGLPRRGRREGG